MVVACRANPRGGDSGRGDSVLLRTGVRRPLLLRDENAGRGVPARPGVWRPGLFTEMAGMISDWRDMFPRVAGDSGVLVLLRPGVGRPLLFGEPPSLGDLVADPDGESVILSAPRPLFGESPRSFLRSAGAVWIRLSVNLVGLPPWAVAGHDTVRVNCDGPSDPPEDKDPVSDPERKWSFLGDPSFGPFEVAPLSPNIIGLSLLPAGDLDRDLERALLADPFADRVPDLECERLRVLGVPRCDPGARTLR